VQLYLVEFPELLGAFEALDSRMTQVAAEAGEKTLQAVVVVGCQH